MDVDRIFRDLITLEAECNERRLYRARKWFSELAFHVARHPESKGKLSADAEVQVRSQPLPVEERTALRFAQSCIDNEEYGRAAHCTQSTKDSHALTRFIHYYAKYLAGEKNKLDNMADVADKNIQFDNDQLKSLHADLDKICSSPGEVDGFESDPAKRIPPDCFILYLYGLVLKDLEFKSQALAIFVRSVNMEERFWPSWQEAAMLISSKDEISNVQLPDCWLRDIFMCEVNLSLRLYPEALQYCINLSRIPVLVESPYLLTQMAIAHHHMQDVDAVVESFRTVRKNDPYRLDQVDLLSNSFFVKGMRPELAALAHHCTEVSKYCPETCIVVGNYYSMRGEHDKAVVYFQRALKLDPRKSDAWTLLGHEFMELKNSAAATMSYRKTLEIDPHDYRAWYGLGQHYDILKMPNYAMYYYSMAQRVQPQDSRMVVALGEMYEKQGKIDEARKCYWKAHLVGDIEGQALLKLGKLYEKMKQTEQAASAYAMYLEQTEENGVPEIDQRPHCYRFLADYHANKRNLEDAHHFAQLCLEHDSTREEARGILRRLTQLRGESSTNESQLTDG